MSPKNATAVSPRFTFATCATGAHHSIEFPEPVYTADLGANAEFNTKLLRFHYTSLVTPASIYDYNMETRERELKKQQQVLGGYDPRQYQSERIHAGEVPISLVYKKGFVRDGRAPMLLYGYGSYGISIDPSFSSDRLSLLDRGFVYAIAHIRGGMDLGKPWHEAGRLLQKKNTFTDFIACAEKLIAEKYTSPARLAIMGRSAGGLLMGAVVNLRPDLFAAVVAGVPFVDSLNTALDASLPLTVGEYEEFGDPGKLEFYDYMKSYAPYENVTAQALSRDARHRRLERPARLLLGACQVGREAQSPEDQRPAAPCSRPTWAAATSAPPAATNTSRKPPSSTRSCWTFYPERI